MSDYIGKGQVDGISFARILSRSPKAGTGTLYTYTVYVDRDIKAKAPFALEVEEILADKRGWTRGNYAFQRLARDGKTQVILARPDTVDRLCAPLKTEGYVSCQMGTKVVINSERWFQAVPHWTRSLQDYRRMVCNHEWGHRLGKGHATCPGPGRRAPCMQQQTYSLGECLANPWPLGSEL